MRLKKNWTVEQLFSAAQAQDESQTITSLQQLKHWERGDRPIHVNAMPALASALGVSIGKLLPNE